MTITLTDSSQQDIDVILPMLYALGASDDVKQITTSREHLLQHFYSAEPAAFCKLICTKQAVAGFIIYSWKWATFTGNKEMYMQAIYIKPEYRRQGIAKKAMAGLAKIALAANCSRIEWIVVKENPLNHSFYDAIGSSCAEHLAIRRLSNESLSRLANIE